MRFVQRIERSVLSHSKPPRSLRVFTLGDSFAFFWTQGLFNCLADVYGRPMERFTAVAGLKLLMVKSELRGRVPELYIQVHYFLSRLHSFLGYSKNDDTFTSIDFTLLTFPSDIVHRSRILCLQGVLPPNVQPDWLSSLG